MTKVNKSRQKTSFDFKKNHVYQMMGQTFYFERWYKNQTSLKFKYSRTTRTFTTKDDTKKNCKEGTFKLSFISFLIVHTEHTHSFIRFLHHMYLSKFLCRKNETYVIQNIFCQRSCKKLYRLLKGWLQIFIKTILFFFFFDFSYWQCPILIKVHMS